MNMVRIGIVGMGNMGRSHGQRLYKGEVPHMTLGAVCDIDETAREWCRANLSGVPVYETAEEMYEKAGIDAALIAIPHYHHAEYAIKAFARGLHVYCEKPAGVYTKQVMEMIDAAKRSGLVFSAGFQQRTRPQFSLIRDMVRNGELGHIKKIIWIITNWYRPQAYHDSCAWRSTWKYEGGGTLVNQNPHNIDLFQWMFGMPDRVMCTIDYGKYYDIEVDDDVTAIFRYDSGTVGIYTTSTGEQPGTNRLEISCDMGKLLYENGKLLFFKNEVNEREFNRTNTAPFPWIKNECIEIPIPKAEMQEHNALLENFARAILFGDELIAPGADSINEVTLADSFYYSDWQGQKWIETAHFDHDGFWAALKQKADSSTYVKRVHAQTETDMSSTF